MTRSGASRAAATGDGHLRGSTDLPWHTFRLSVMATQASAKVALRVVTAYEFLQARFDLETRLLAAARPSARPRSSR